MRFDGSHFICSLVIGIPSNQSLMFVHSYRCDSNRYSLQYFITLASHRSKIPAALGDKEDGGDDTGSAKDEEEETSDMEASDEGDGEGRVKGLADVEFSSDDEDISELVKH